MTIGVNKGQTALLLFDSLLTLEVRHKKIFEVCWFVPFSDMELLPACPKVHILHMIINVHKALNQPMSIP